MNQAMSYCQTLTLSDGTVATLPVFQSLDEYNAFLNILMYV